MCVCVLHVCVCVCRTYLSLSRVCMCERKQVGVCSGYFIGIIPLSPPTLPAPAPPPDTGGASEVVLDRQEGAVVGRSGGQ